MFVVVLLLMPFIFSNLDIITFAIKINVGAVPLNSQSFQHIRFSHLIFIGRVHTTPPASPSKSSGPGNKTTNKTQQQQKNVIISCYKWTRWKTVNETKNRERKIYYYICESNNSKLDTHFHIVLVLAEKAATTKMSQFKKDKNSFGIDSWSKDEKEGVRNHKRDVKVWQWLNLLSFSPPIGN